MERGVRQRNFKGKGEKLQRERGVRQRNFKGKGDLDRGISKGKES